jgi:NACalpha-BTF3-like transcription factor
MRQKGRTERQDKMDWYRYRIKKMKKDIEDIRRIMGQIKKKRYRRHPPEVTKEYVLTYYFTLGQKRYRREEEKHEDEKHDEEKHDEKMKKTYRCSV